MARSASWMKAGESLVLAGDLNARLSLDLVQRVEKSGFDVAPVEGSTYHFDVGFDLFGAIDHLAHANRLVPVRGPVVVRNKIDDEWPTDHYPVVVDYRLDP